MKTEYKGYTITYSELLERFEVNIDDSSMSSEKLKDLKKRIDQLEKKEKKFDRIDVFVSDGWGYSIKLNPAQITSIAETASYRSGIDVWVVKNGKRSKESLNSLYLNNDKNLNLYEEIKGHRVIIEEHKDTIDSLFKKMDRPVLPKEAS